MTSLDTAGDGMAGTGPVILSGHSLRFGYDAARSGPVFEALDVEVRQGEVLAVLGPNGGGKTTLLRVLSGSLTPQRGTVRLSGAEVRWNRRGVNALRRSVQLVFQDPDDQLFSASVRQDVSFGPLNQGLKPDAVRDRVAWALEALGVTALAEQPTHLLSYGQRKRVVLAGAVAMRPSVLVLDEPTAGLDPAGVESLLETLDGLRAAGTTLLVSTHDVDLAYRWADRALLLDGEVLGIGPVREVLADPPLLEAARLRPAWGPAVGRALRGAGLLAPDAPDPSTPEEVAGITGA
ncbi:cobalt/nickel transport system ATP-binding protein [Lipingzhangella halophila]|uniref:ABC transporter ATP-binding protein n=1 Tax=Lipingzhangella halophila TaxID=1783352 RepID=A0A7W7W508_9ACTN|nr:ATP-binding cassette domain-containing protein [Lipingzhangella halophila]MBB4933270.1 cobalt/nickel transport system ATP-binding protein [Lipingzhangella halophila]